MGEDNEWNWLAILHYVRFMSRDDNRQEIAELRERVVKLEVKMEELTKRIESISNYAKELYNYLQRRG